MDIGSIIGFISGGVFILLSILMALNFDVARAVDAFVDPTSIMITFGGAFAATLIANPVSKTLNALKTISKVFKPPNVNPSEAISKIITLANLARKEGILSLEESTKEMDDAFLQKGVMLIVDGTDPELVRNILETELAYIEGRHGEVRGIWDFISSCGPAWGMIGTLIGLIIMLLDLNDPSTLGPKMAVAIVTTFYGSMLSNFVATPVSTKLKGYSGDEVLMKSVLIEGMLSIQAGENPRIIEEKLKAFLSPAMRNTADDKEKKDEE